MRFPRSTLTNPKKKFDEKDCMFVDIRDPGSYRENGFKNVASMRGGLEAWRQVYEHEAG
jgi:rhodanese-related sulfurtransferase